ncbi:hypothetical protein FBR05_14410, partial [Deltaproteobacteria bacterium PRO3]|nr:hypothetical protein [Deltaproteobacteria bacterium PRO3]
MPVLRRGNRRADLFGRNDAGEGRGQPPLLLRELPTLAHVLELTAAAAAEIGTGRRHTVRGGFQQGRLRGDPPSFAGDGKGHDRLLPVDQGDAASPLVQAGDENGFGLHRNIPCFKKTRRDIGKFQRKEAVMSAPKPVPWTQAGDADLAPVRGICLDIDETLSTHGKLTAEAYAALWSLKDAGYFVVPVTGRPAGWCDHFARFWPVDAVVGENGAFTFFMKNGVRSRIDTPGVAAHPKRGLEALGRKILERFPHAKWASDQAYREYDLAIDFCEDVPPWPREDVDALVRLCEAEGAHAK